MIRQVSFKLPLVLSIVAAVFKDCADLVAENVALHHQLACFIHRGPRPRLRSVDRVFWVLINASEITVSRYMPKRHPPAGSRQRWDTFLRNHLYETRVIDFAVVPAATFGILYVFFVPSLERRRVLHSNVTRHPTAEWTAQQVVEVCSFYLRGRFPIRDNDKIYGTEFRDRVDGLGLEQMRTAFYSQRPNRPLLPSTERICRKMDCQPTERLPRPRAGHQ